MLPCLDKISTKFEDYIKLFMLHFVSDHVGSDDLDLDFSAKVIPVLTVKYVIVYNNLCHYCICCTCCGFITHVYVLLWSSSFL